MLKFSACVYVGKLGEAVKELHLWDERTFRKADCVEWKADPPCWCYTYPKTEEEDEVVVAFITEKPLTEKEMKFLEPFARSLISKEVQSCLK